MDAMNLTEALQGRRLITHIPAGMPDWVGACEVLLQERIRAWSFEPTDLDRASEALALFGRRARIGVHGIRTPDDAAAAARCGVHFMTSPIAAVELLDAAGEIPVALGALTPNEVQRALDLGASTVQIVPADGMGTAYGRALGELFGGVSLLATGRFERYQCDMWRDAGAELACITSAILFTDQAAAVDPDLDAVRRRCQEFSDIA